MRKMVLGMMGVAAMATVLDRATAQSCDGEWAVPNVLSTCASQGVAAGSVINGGDPGQGVAWCGNFNCGVSRAWAEACQNNGTACEVTTFTAGNSVTTTAGGIAHQKHRVHLVSFTPPGAGGSFAGP